MSPRSNFLPLPHQRYYTNNEHIHISTRFRIALPSFDNHISLLAPHRLTPGFTTDSGTIAILSNF